MKSSTHHLMVKKLKIHDRHCSLLNWFLKNLSDHFTTQILETLCHIQEILYLEDNKRTPLTILSLIITTFKHAILLKAHLQENIKPVSERKFFGIYYHSLVRH